MDHLQSWALSMTVLLHVWMLAAVLEMVLGTLEVTLEWEKQVRIIFLYSAEMQLIIIFMKGLLSSLVAFLVGQNKNLFGLIQECITSFMKIVHDSNGVWR